MILWGGYRNVYALGVNPLVMKWNFTRGKKVIPYFLAQGGMLWSTDYIPPGNTSKINFTEGPGVGLNYFLRPGRSVNCRFPGHASVERLAGRSQSGSQFEFAVRGWIQLVEAVAESLKDGSAD